MVEETSVTKTQFYQVRKFDPTILTNSKELLVKKSAENEKTKSVEPDYLWSESIKKNKRRSEDSHNNENKKMKQDDPDEFEDISEDVFDWNEYLKETSSKYVPKQFFRHLVPECMCGFEPGMKLEVPNRDYKNTYWLATIITRAPPLILVRYEGFQERNVADFWCNTLSDDIHPVGWCARNKRALKPPKAIQHKEKNWYAYLIKHLTGARKASENLFLKKSHPAHYLRAGQYVEVIDQYSPTCYWLAKITEVFSGRLNLQYEGWDETQQEFWCYYLNENLRPVGYGIENGLTLYPPKGAGIFTHSKFSRLTDKLLALSKRSDLSVFKSLFTGWTNKQPHNLQVGMKLEALHPNDPTSICVASVARVFDEYFFLVKVDNLLSTQDDIASNSFVAHVDSPYIFPTGFCSKNGLILHQPRGYNGKFTWESYTKYTKSIPIPAEFFQQVYKETPASLLEPGMKLEAVDKENTTNICVCTISKVIGNHVWLNIDGDTRIDQVFHVDSFDIYPVGWCEATGHELQWPRPNTLEQKNRISSLRHTETRKNRLEVLRKGKLREKPSDDPVEPNTKTNKLKKDKRHKRQYGRRGVSRKRVLYEDKDENGITDTSIAIVCINRLAEEYNSEESIKVNFRLDSEGRLPTQIVTIDDDDDNDVFPNSKNHDPVNKSKYSESDITYFSFIRVKPNDLSAADDELFQRKLNENSLQTEKPSVNMLSPNSTNRETRRSLNSVVAMLRASRRQTRNHLTQLEQYKQRKVKKHDSTSDVENKQKKSHVSLTITNDKPASQVIDLSNDEETNHRESDELSSCEQNGSIKIPGKGEFRIVEKIITKEGDKNKICLKLGKPILHNGESNSSKNQSQTKSASVPTTPVDDMYTLQNMARGHLGVDMIMRNRFNKVRTLCKDLPKNPLHWSSKHVATFVKNADFTKYSKSFFDQEVDGHSFLLLTVQEIHHILGVHLGPAMKLHDYIFTLQQLVNDSYLSKNDAQGGSMSRDTESILLEKEKPTLHVECNVTYPNEGGKSKEEQEDNEKTLPLLNNRDVLNWINTSVIPETIKRENYVALLSEHNNGFSAHSKISPPLEQIKELTSRLEDNRHPIPMPSNIKVPHMRLFPASEYDFIPVSGIPTQSQPIMTCSNSFQTGNMVSQSIPIAAEFPVRFIPVNPFFPEKARQPIPMSMEPNNLVISMPDKQQQEVTSQMFMSNLPAPMKRCNDVLYPMPIHTPVLSNNDCSARPYKKKYKLQASTHEEPLPLQTTFSSMESPLYAKKMAKINMVLQQKVLWEKFHQLGTEMILTRLGRRMFPNLQVRAVGMDPRTKYAIILDFVPVDHFRYKYEYDASKWLVACEETTPVPARVYVHPESPASGENWMKSTIDFTKCKLTNNPADRKGHILMHSMHKYQPRIHVIYWDGTLPLQINPLDLLRIGCRKEFLFDETQFIAVTAYQNSQITHLKIQSNPFARGFRGDWKRFSEAERSKKRKTFSLEDGSAMEESSAMDESKSLEEEDIEDELEEEAENLKLNTQCIL